MTISWTEASVHVAPAHVQRLHDTHSYIFLLCWITVNSVKRAHASMLMDISESFPSHLPVSAAQLLVHTYHKSYYFELDIASCDKDIANAGCAIVFIFSLIPQYTVYIPSSVKFKPFPKGQRRWLLLPLETPRFIKCRTILCPHTHTDPHAAFSTGN